MGGERELEERGEGGMEGVGDQGRGRTGGGGGGRGEDMFILSLASSLVEKSKMFLISCYNVLQSSFLHSSYSFLSLQFLLLLDCPL